MVPQYQTFIDLRCQYHIFIDQRDLLVGLYWFRVDTGVILKKSCQMQFIMNLKQTGEKSVKVTDINDVTSRVADMQPCPILISSQVTDPEKSSLRVLHVNCK